MKRFYAEQGVWGADDTMIRVFTSKKERDDFVSNTDYTNVISAADVKARYGKNIDKYVD